MNFDFLELQTKITQVYNFLYSSNIPKYVLFIFFALFAILLGRYIPSLISFLVHRFVPSEGQKIYDNLIEPIKKNLRTSGTFVLLYLSLSWRLFVLGECIGSSIKPIGA